MDEVTQQNSALVEENAATAKTLEQQSQCDGRAGLVLQLGRQRPRGADTGSRDSRASRAAAARGRQIVRQFPLGIPRSAQSKLEIAAQVLATSRMIAMCHA